jgi:hypothetical protein
MTAPGTGAAAPVPGTFKSRPGRESCFPNTRRETNVIILGLILLLLGVVLGIGILYTLGVILLVVGLILMLLGRTNRTFGGRAHYW